MLISPERKKYVKEMYEYLYAEMPGLMYLSTLLAGVAGIIMIISVTTFNLSLLLLIIPIVVANNVLSHSMELKWQKHYKEICDEKNIANSKKRIENKKSSGDYWECYCGQLNANYVTTCPCGLGINQSKALKKEEENKKSETKRKQAELENLNLLSKYKEMFDAGIISEEEFAEKKKELINK